MVCSMLEHQAHDRVVIVGLLIATTLGRKDNSALYAILLSSNSTLCGYGHSLVRR
jgi:hypothetical protein